MKKQTAETFWSKVDIGHRDQCWLWKGSTLRGGYGQVKWAGKQVLAHRLAAYLSGQLETIDKRKLDEKSDLVCHKCDVRACCNPSHFFIGSSDDNMKDAASKKRMVGRKGESHHGVKLSEDDVRRILNMASEGTKSSQIAEVFPVSARSIRRIISGDRWSHVSSKGLNYVPPALGDCV
jgi:hypothetical protein